MRVSITGGGAADERTCNNGEKKKKIVTTIKYLGPGVFNAAIVVAISWFGAAKKKKNQQLLDTMYAMPVRRTNALALCVLFVKVVTRL